MKCAICDGILRLTQKDLFDDRYGAPGLYSIYECKKCGFGRTEPVLSKEKIGEFYKKYYPLSKYDASAIKSNAKVWNKFLAWLLGINNTTHWLVKPNSSVLDIGSGSGQSLLEIEKIGSTAYGIEPDPSAQKIAKKLDLNVFKGFLSDNPFPKIKFDFITGSQVIEHEPDPVKFLILARKRLETNGKIILSFPNYDSIYRKMFGRKWINWHIPYHINFFNQKSFLKLTKKVDLKIVSFQTITPNIWTVIQLKMIFSEASEGVKNEIWMNAPNNLFGRALQILLFIFVIPINRLIDYLEFGDSILVVLENGKK